LALNTLAPSAKSAAQTGGVNQAEVHPSLKSADIFPKMRNLTDKDLTNIAGHILVAPKILGEKWGGGKIYF